MTSARYRFRTIEGLGSVAALWLVISVIGDSALAVWNLADAVLLLSPGLLSPEATELWQITGLVGFGQIAVTIVTIIIVGRWIYRASANTHATIRRLDTSPPWAVGWYFVPFANLWKPYGAMAEIVRANRPTSPDLPLGLWWGLWLASGISGNLSTRLVLFSSESETLIASSILAVVSGLMGIGAALCLRRIVIAVTDTQTASKQAEVF